MKIRNELGEVVTIPKNLESKVKKAIQNGEDVDSMLTPLMRNGGKLKKAENGFGNFRNPMEVYGIQDPVTNYPQTQEQAMQGSTYNPNFRMTNPLQQPIEGLQQTFDYNYNATNSMGYNPNTGDNIGLDRSMTKIDNMPGVNYNGSNHPYGNQDQNSFSFGDTFANSTNKYFNRAAAYGNAALSTINGGKGIMQNLGNSMQNQRVKRQETQNNAWGTRQQSLDYRPQDTQYNRNPGIYADGGMINDYKNSINPNLEVEGGEHINLPNGLSAPIQGNSHERGGIDMNLPPGSMIFSKKLKDPTTKKSYSKLANKFSTEKDIKHLEDNAKFLDKSAKATTQLNIQMKNQKLQELFEQQENEKLQGTFGVKVANETAQARMFNPEENLGMNYGGMIPKAGNGIITQAQQDSIYNKYLPEATSWDMDPNDNNPKTRREAKGYDWFYGLFQSQDMSQQDAAKLASRLYNGAREKEGLSSPVSNLPVINLQNLQNNTPTQVNNENTSNLPTQVVPNETTNNSAKNLRYNSTGIWQGDNLDLKKRGSQWNAMTHYSSLDGYAKAVGYTGKIDINNPQKTSLEIQKFVGEKYPELVKQYHEQYGQPYHGDPYDGKLGVRWEAIADAINKPITDLPKQSPEIPPPPPPPLQGDAKSELTTFNNKESLRANAMNINLGGFNIPSNYARDPIGLALNNPSYVDPRYLDIQPQLNDIQRGQSSFQRNMGSRTSTDVANLLQSQANGYDQANQVYGTKYNYDSQQDSQAQQFNAQARNRNNEFNIGEIDKFNDLRYRRDGALNTQMRTDEQDNIQNQYLRDQFNQTRDYINNTFMPDNNNSFVNFGSTQSNGKVEDDWVKQEKNADGTVTKYYKKKQENGGKVKLNLKKIKK